MENINNISNVKAEDRVVITMTSMELDAIETALMIARHNLRIANVKAIEDFEQMAPGSEEAHEAQNTMMKFLICQSVVEATLDRISDFQ